MCTRVSAGDEATLCAARYGAGDVEERAEPAPTRDDELLGDLCSATPLLEGAVDELQILLSDLLIRLDPCQAEEGACLVYVAEHDYPQVVLAHPTGPEQGRGPVVAPAGRDRRVAILLTQKASCSLRGHGQGSPGGHAAQA